MKVAIHCLYEVAHGLSIAVSVYELIRIRKNQLSRFWSQAFT